MFDDVFFNDFMKIHAVYDFKAFVEGIMG